MRHEVSEDVAERLAVDYDWIGRLGEYEDKRGVKMARRTGFTSLTYQLTPAAMWEIAEDHGIAPDVSKIINRHYPEAA